MAGKEATLKITYDALVERNELLKKESQHGIVQDSDHSKSGTEML